jgi:hypothetical protein
MHRKPNLTEVGQKPKKIRRLTLARKTREDEKEGKCKFATITTALSSSVSLHFRQVLLEYVDRFSQLTVLANMVATQAAMKLVHNSQVPEETLRLVFNQNFFNWCSQVTSTLKGKHQLIQVHPVKDSLETRTVKAVINEAYEDLKTHGGVWDKPLPPREYLSRVINTESRQQLTALTMMYSYDRLKARRYQAIRRTITLFWNDHRSPKWPNKIYPSTLAGILVQVLNTQIAQPRNHQSKLSYVVQEFLMHRKPDQDTLQWWDR